MFGTYAVSLPVLSSDEKDFIDMVKLAVSKNITDVDLQKIFLINENKGKFITDVRNLVTSLDIVLLPGERSLIRSKVDSFVGRYLPDAENRRDVVDVISDFLFSFGVISPLFNDPNIEEIMINGSATPVYVVHRSKGLCKSNIVFTSDDELNWLVNRLMKAAKLSTQEKPIYDGSLVDGTRLSLILPPLTRCPVITLRRFTPQPFSLLELVKNNTLSIDMAAFLWLAVEGMGTKPANILVVGGAGSGKTTTLNALLGFVPIGSRVILIEDTPEINVMHRENSINLYTHYDFKKGVEVDLYDLVKASLRMRPDRIIIGEVRGREAEELFVAMDVGCAGSMGTMHANSAKEAISRLTNPPMSVPEGLIPLIDLFVVQQRINVPGKGLIRRITEIVEVQKVETINTRWLFKWDSSSDTFIQSEIPPTLLDNLSKVTDRAKRSIMDELERRKQILSDALKNGIISYNEVYPYLERRLGDINGS